MHDGNNIYWTTRFQMPWVFNPARYEKIRSRTGDFLVLALAPEIAYKYDDPEKATLYIPLNTLRISEIHEQMDLVKYNKKLLDISEFNSAKTYFESDSRLPIYQKIINGNLPADDSSYDANEIPTGNEQDRAKYTKGILTDYNYGGVINYSGDDTNTTIFPLWPIVLGNIVNNSASSGEYYPVGLNSSDSTLNSDHTDYTERYNSPVLPIVGTNLETPMIVGGDVNDPIINMLLFANTRMHSKSNGFNEELTIYFGSPDRVDNSYDTTDSTVNDSSITVNEFTEPVPEN